MSTSRRYLRRYFFLFLRRLSCLITSPPMHEPSAKRATARLLCQVFIGRSVWPLSRMSSILQLNTLEPDVAAAAVERGTAALLLAGREPGPTSPPTKRSSRQGRQPSQHVGASQARRDGPRDFRWANLSFV